MLSDPDPNFNFDAAVQIRSGFGSYRTLFTHENFFYFYSQQCQFTVYLSRQRQRGHNFQYFVQFIEIFWKI